MTDRWLRIGTSARLGRCRHAAQQSLRALLLYSALTIISASMTTMPSYAGGLSQGGGPAAQRVQRERMAEPGQQLNQTAQAAQSTAPREDEPARPAERDSKPGAHKTVVGHASWYGPGFNGRRTATGERFSQHKLTAAARNLPLGSKVKVTNLHNGRSTVVKVNDCGPFRDGRKIDLSKRAAEKLGMVHKGEATVKAKVISKPPGATDCES
jgi:rare lipoprotein A (peptidoglycan hydrolase)